MFRQASRLLTHFIDGNCTGGHAGHDSAPGSNQSQGGGEGEAGVAFCRATGASSASGNALRSSLLCNDTYSWQMLHEPVSPDRCRLREKVI